MRLELEGEHARWCDTRSQVTTKYLDNMSGPLAPEESTIQ